MKVRSKLPILKVSVWVPGERDLTTEAREESVLRGALGEMEAAARLTPARVAAVTNAKRAIRGGLRM
jgi:hypothetical protein